MSRDAMRAIQPLDPWKHGPAVLKLYADNFGAEAEGGVSKSTTMLAPTQLLDLDDTVGFVWQEAGEVLGAITCHRHPPQSDVWVISGLVTDARHRRRGIGIALLQTAVHHAAAGGAKNVTLQVDARNTAAAALYARAGFVRAGEMVHLEMDMDARLAVFPASVRRASLSEGSAILMLVERVAGRSSVARLTSPYSMFEDWQRRTNGRITAYLDVAMPVTAVVFAQAGVLAGQRYKIMLTPICDGSMSTAACAELVAGVLRALALKQNDAVSCKVPAQSLNTVLGLSRICFSQRQKVIDMNRRL